MYDVMLTLQDGRKIRLGFSVSHKQAMNIHFEWMYGDKATASVFNAEIVTAITREEFVVLNEIQA